MLSTIQAWRASLGEDAGINANHVELWYPDPDPRADSPSRRTAEWVEQQDPSLQARAIARVPDPRTGAWRCSGSPVSLLECESVVILDWGALSGNTLMQMLQIAGASGAKAVLVCVVISQMPIEQEQFLSVIGTLRMELLSSITAANHTLEQRELVLSAPSQASVRSVVHVDIRFLARLPIRAYLPQNCPVCEQLRNFPEEKQTLDIVRKHLGHSKRQLSLRYFNDPRDPEEDLGGLDLHSDDYLWMLDYRECLEQALVSTRIRQQMVENIFTWANVPARSDPAVDKTITRLIRLLFVESQWLHLPPLRLKRVREAVGRIAMRESLRTELPLTERRCALGVLRAADKALYVDHFDELFRAACDAEELHPQLVYDAFTYISRSYHHSDAMLQPLDGALRRVDLSIRDGGLTVAPEIADAIHHLLASISLVTQRTGAKELSQARAWRQLRQYMEALLPHSDPVEGSRRLRLSNIERERLEELRASDEEPRRAALQDDNLYMQLQKHLPAEWIKCEVDLDREIVPLLARISDALFSDDITRVVGSEAVTWLKQVVGRAELDLPALSWPLGRMMQAFAERPEAILERDNALRFIRETHALWDHIFRVEASEEGGTEHSDLYTLLTQIPVGIREVFDQALGEFTFDIARLVGLNSAETEFSSVEVSFPDEHVLVFCPARLLVGTFRQLLENVRKYRIEENSTPRLEISVRREVGRIHCVLANDKTASRPRAGTGIASFNDRLSRFGASVSRIEPPGWATFAVLLDLVEMDSP